MLCFSYKMLSYLWLRAGTTNKINYPFSLWTLRGFFSFSFNKFISISAGNSPWGLQRTPGVHRWDLGTQLRLSSSAVLGQSLPKSLEEEILPGLHTNFISFLNPGGSNKQVVTQKGWRRSSPWFVQLNSSASTATCLVLTIHPSAHLCLSAVNIPLSQGQMVSRLSLIAQKPPWYFFQR